MKWPSHIYVNQLPVRLFCLWKRVHMVRVSNPPKTPAEVNWAYSHEYSITISQIWIEMCTSNRITHRQAVHSYLILRLHGQVWIKHQLSFIVDWFCPCYSWPLTSSHNVVPDVMVVVSFHDLQFAQWGEPLTWVSVPLTHLEVTTEVRDKVT